MEKVMEHDLNQEEKDYLEKLANKAILQFSVTESKLDEIDSQLLQMKMDGKHINDFDVYEKIEEIFSIQTPDEFKFIYKNNLTTKLNDSDSSKLACGFSSLLKRRLDVIEHILQLRYIHNESMFVLPDECCNK